MLVAVALIAGSAAAQNNSSDGLNGTLNGSNLSEEAALQQNQTDGSVDTVIVASSESHIDAALADSASERLGIPVVLTDPDNLSDSTSQAMTDLGVERAVIVGGPVALSENVEEDINGLTSEETTRVFGQTASDTSIEVANYFWPNGYNQTTIVQARLFGEQDDTYRLISAAANTAEDNPLLIAEINSTEQEQVVNEVVTAQGVNQVDAYTVGTSTNNSLTQDLNQLGTEAQVNQGSVQELSTQLYSEVQDNSENRTLYALAGNNFEYGIPTYASPDSVTYTVTQERLDQSAEYIDNSGYTQINTVGEQEISDELTGQINASVQNEYVPVDSAADTSVQILEDNVEEWNTQRNEELLREIGLINEQATENDTQTTENLTPENQGETILPNNETQENETAEDNQTGVTGDAQSSIELSADSSTVTAEATYTSDQQYEREVDVNTSNQTVTFTFTLVPTDSNETSQEESTYEFNEEVEPDNGSYETRAELIVDGETVDTAEGTAEIQ